MASSRVDIGIKRLYHATSSEAGARIGTQRKIVAGLFGMFGAGIYFADTPEAARPKSQHGDTVIVTADVDMGRSLVLDSPSNGLTLDRVRQLGCDSVKGRSSARALWDYVVFESSRITLISVEGSLPFLPQPQSPSTRQFLPTNGPLNGIIAHLTRQCGGNVDECNIVKITSSTPHQSSLAGRNVADLATRHAFLGAADPNWVCYDFRTRKILPTHYSLVCAGEWALKSWVIETSMTGDHDDWKIIDCQQDGTDSRQSQNPRTFKISDAQQCRYIRLTRTRRQWEVGLFFKRFLEITAWEIFGSLIE
jgi:hypothetical protein